MKIIFSSEMVELDAGKEEMIEVIKKFSCEDGELILLDNAGELRSFVVDAEGLLGYIFDNTFTDSDLHERIEEEIVTEQISEMNLEQLYDFACVEDNDGVQEMIEEVSDEQQLLGKKKDHPRRIFHAKKKRWIHRVLGRTSADDSCELSS